MAHDEEPLLANPPTQEVATHVHDYESFTEAAEVGRDRLPHHRLHRPDDPVPLSAAGMKIAVLKEEARGNPLRRDSRDGEEVHRARRQSRSRRGPAKLRRSATQISKRPAQASARGPTC